MANFYKEKHLYSRSQNSILILNKSVCMSATSSRLTLVDGQSPLERERRASLGHAHLGGCWH